MKLQMRTTAGTTVRTPSPLWKLLYVGLSIVILLGVANATTQPASASHIIGWWNGNSGGDFANWHQTLMHTAATEKICTINNNTTGGSPTDVSDTSFRNVLRDKLLSTNLAGQANPANWDRLAGNKVFIDFPVFNGVVKECNQLTSAERNSIPIEAYLAHDVTRTDNGFGQSPCTSFAGNSACTENKIRIWNATARHHDMQWSYMWFREQIALYKADHSYVGSPQWVINHEFGHVLGLNDGTGDNCAGSIMHSGKGGCGILVTWPTQSDRDSATNYANRVDNCVQGNTNKCP